MCEDELQASFYWCSQIDAGEIAMVVCILGEFVRCVLHFCSQWIFTRSESNGCYL